MLTSKQRAQLRGMAMELDTIIQVGKGGINDAMSSAPIGSVSGSFNVADFDAETYIGGLETLFYYAYENFPGAKFGHCAALFKGNGLQVLAVVEHTCRGNRGNP